MLISRFVVLVLSSHLFNLIYVSAAKLMSKDSRLHHKIRPAKSIMSLRYVSIVKTDKVIIP